MRDDSFVKYRPCWRFLSYTTGAWSLLYWSCCTCVHIFIPTFIFFLLFFGESVAGERTQTWGQPGGVKSTNLSVEDWLLCAVCPLCVYIGDVMCIQAMGVTPFFRHQILLNIIHVFCSGRCWGDAVHPPPTHTLMDRISLPAQHWTSVPVAFACSLWAVMHPDLIPFR